MDAKNAARYVPRLVDRLLDLYVVQAPAILVTGPRAVGKTTTIKRRVASVAKLEVPEVAQAFRIDADAALGAMDEPVLLDEWQMVPEVVGAVRRAVDDDPSPGRFLITGSASAELDSSLWPATGRLIRMPMFPMTVGEQKQLIGGETFFDRLSENSPHIEAQPQSLSDYVSQAVAGGFPVPALQMSGRVRADWLATYIEQILTHDLPQISASPKPRDAARMRRYLEAYALNSAGMADQATIFRAADISRVTAVEYEALLTALSIAVQVQAWTGNRLKRVAANPKRYLVDPALVVALLNVDERAILTDGDLLGRLLDTFVAAQLRADAAVARCRPRLFHLRTRGGRQEVDIVAELQGGAIVGIEVKAGGVVSERDARHLIWLRDELGDRFHLGFVLHTGRHVFELSDRIIAAPIAAIWAA